MSSFFRDSNLFASRNNKPLFSTNIESSIGNNKLSFENKKHSSNLKSLNALKNINYKVGKTAISNQNNDDQADDHNYGDSTQDSISLYEKYTSPIEDKSGENNEAKSHKENNNGNDDDDGMDDNDEDDDDIEITEVRDVVDNPDNEDTNIWEISGTLHDNEISDENNNIKIKKEGRDAADDVSMEYLLNTISHLNEKNSNLQKQINNFKIENNNLTDQLLNKSNSINNLKNQVSKIKSNILNSNSILKDLRNDHIDHSSKHESILNDLNNTKKSISKQNENVLSLKKIMLNMKTQLSNNEATIESKNQSIENLKKRSDDLSGRLSEEKIKNNELNNLFKVESKAYEAELMKINEKYQTMVENISADNEKFGFEFDTFKKFVDFTPFSLTFIYIILTSLTVI